MRIPGEISTHIDAGAAYHIENIDKQIQDLRGQATRKIMLDIDATIYPVVDALRLIPGGENCWMDGCKEWADLGKMCRGDVADIFDQASSFEIMKKVGLFPGARSGVRKLYSAGVQIDIVTHRGEDNLWALKDFLSFEGIEYHRILSDLTVDKVDYCLEHGINIIIDDHPEIIEKALSEGLQPVTMVWPYNEKVANHPGVTGVYDWLAMTREVLRLAR